MKILEYHDKGGTGDAQDQAQKYPVDKDLQDDTVTSPVLFHSLEPKKVPVSFYFINISLN